tara:strand:+ start:474 stop:1184 length:711 start_codon:yes stop_codon:yes gene_type:complete
MTVFAVDGDILAFRMSVVCENAPAVTELIDGKMHQIAEHTGVQKYRIYLTGSGNFRNAIGVTKPYKGNRLAEKPEFLSEARAYLRDKYAAVTVHGYEADDAIASDMVQNGAVHCGQDKDLHQISGEHYDLVTGEWLTITEDEALLNFYRQILTGDSTDNIPGLPGIGAKKAEKAIHDPETAIEDAKALYIEVCEKKLPDIDVATYWKEQVQLVQMVTTLNVLDMVTTTVKPKLLRI